VIEAREQRLKRLQARRAVRAWEYRQRRGAKGVWARLRRLLAGAQSVAVIDDDQAAGLLAEGFQAQEAGRDLEPPKTILLLPWARFSQLTNGRDIAVALSAELLEARNLVLTPFTGSEP